MIKNCKKHKPKKITIKILILAKIILKLLPLLEQRFILILKKCTLLSLFQDVVFF